MDGFLLGDSSHGHVKWARYLSYFGVVGEAAREEGRLPLNSQSQEFQYSFGGHLKTGKKNF